MRHEYGVDRLRRLCEQVSSSLEEQRERWQAQQLLHWLEKAHTSRGKNKPVLAVGRDGFHVAEPITKMGEATHFTSIQHAQARVARMRKLLKKPGGAGRVLHGAAAMKSCLGLHTSGRANFEGACNYLRNQREVLNYAEYKRLGLQIGSGVIEAACKTDFTQRLKLCGMP